jgi:hypothetical protein
MDSRHRMFAPGYECEWGVCTRRATTTVDYGKTPCGELLTPRRPTLAVCRTCAPYARADRDQQLDEHVRYCPVCDRPAPPMRRMARDLNTPAMEKLVRSCFKNSPHRDRPMRDYRTEFSDGHWWVINRRTGARYDAVTMADGFDFEQANGPIYFFV